MSDSDETGRSLDQPKPVPETSAAERLRAFEDEHLGEDAVRLHGDRVERGSGSLYQRLSPAHREAHALIEKTVDTEQKLGAARAALAVAENDHNTALKAAEEAEAHLAEVKPGDARTQEAEKIT